MRADLLDRRPGDAQQAAAVADRRRRDELIGRRRERHRRDPRGDVRGVARASRVPSDQHHRQHVEPAQALAQIAVVGAQRQRIVHHELALDSRPQPR